MSPERADLVLSSNIPHIELCVFVGDGLDVEAYCRDGRYVLLELEVVEDGYGGSIVSRSGTSIAGRAYLSSLLRQDPA
jgi:hypothetical protein